MFGHSRCLRLLVPLLQRSVALDSPWCLLADGASHDAPTSGHQHLCVSGDGRPNASRNPWIWGMGPLSDLASRILFVYAGLTRGFRPGLNVFEIAPRNLEFKGVIRPWSIAFGNTNP